MKRMARTKHHGGILLKVVSGGHTWPGGSQCLPQFVIGRVAKDFDATTEIREFFSRHERE